MKSNMHGGASKFLFQRAEKLRNNETHAELVLWSYLKAKPLGFKFRRQHPYGIYILDFYCHKLKLVIEIDGPIHLEEKVKERDEQRQKLLEADGLSVIRFTNEEILTKLESVTSTIELYIQEQYDRNE